VLVQKEGEIGENKESKKEDAKNVWQYDELDKPQSASSKGRRNWRK
jgi:hypothetical protein